MLSSPGRRDTLLEKPIIPPEPPEPVLHGSMAIGAVSLAVAKTSATLAGTPLYLTLALLKHDQVSDVTSHHGWNQKWGRTRSRHPPLPSLSRVLGAAVDILYAFADGICAELWEVVTWEATFNERSDVYPQSWINNQTSTG